MRRTTVPPEALMGPAEVAQYVGVPVTTIYAWNSRNSGPRRFRVGKHVRYRQVDVDAWLDQRSEGGPAGRGGAA